MARIESSIQVPKSIEDTFAFLNKSESHLKFIPGCVEFAQTSAGAFGRVGATVRGAVRYFGLRIPVAYEIIEHQANERLAMKGQMGPVAFTDGYVLGKSKGNTVLKFWLELNPTGWTKILAPFAGLIGKIHAWETLRNLKRELDKIEEIASSPLRGSSQ